MAEQSIGTKGAGDATGAAMHRLLAVGRRQGAVTFDQIKDILPLEKMSAVAIAQAIDEVERAGIEIELEDELAAERPGDPAARPEETPEIHLDPGEETAMRSEAAAGRAPDGQEPPAAPSRDAGRGLRAMIAISVTLPILLALAAVFLS